jgi:hypothetical protein
MAAVPPIRDPGFTAEVTGEAPARLVLRGNADIQARTSLTALVDTLHAHLVERAARVVIVDLAALEFMNASSFNVLVGWLALIQELPPEQRYRLVFRSNARIPWQTRSLRTLTCFAIDLVEIEGG